MISSAASEALANATMRMGQVFLGFFMVMFMSCRPCNGGSSSSLSSAATSSAEAIGPDGCPVTWTLIGDQCLYPLMSPEFWENAFNSCKAEGGALFFPESEESMNFVRGLITYPCLGFWLGCIDREPSNGQFECPDQDGVYWNSEADYRGYWNWTTLPSSSGLSDAYCTATYGTSPAYYWLEWRCIYPGICPVCSRNREPVTTMAPLVTTGAGFPIPVGPIARHRSAVYKASASEVGCLSNSYTFLIYSAPSRIRCASICLAHQECASFNFYERRSQNCHLNSRRIGSVPADEVIYNTACTYFE